MEPWIMKTDHIISWYTCEQVLLLWTGSNLRNLCWPPCLRFWGFSTVSDLPKNIQGLCDPHGTKSQVSQPQLVSFPLHIYRIKTTILICRWGYMQNFLHTAPSLSCMIIKICFWSECLICWLVVFGHNEQYKKWGPQTWMKSGTKWKIKELNKIFEARKGCSFLNLVLQWSKS